MIDHEGRAEEVVRAWFHDDLPDGERMTTDHTDLAKRIAALSRAVERTVWEEAARKIVDDEDEFTSFVELGHEVPGVEFDVEKFAAWCRAQGA